MNQQSSIFMTNKKFKDQKINNKYNKKILKICILKEKCLT